MKIYYGVLVALFLAIGVGAKAQGTVDDYRRAYALQEKFSSKLVYNANVEPQWIGDTHHFWYVRNTPEGRVYVVVNADKQTRKELFDHQHLAEALSKTSGKEVKADKLVLSRLRINKKLDSLHFVFDNQRYTYAIRKKSLTSQGALPPAPKPRHWMEVDDEKGAAPVPSPDGTRVAYIKNHNIYVRQLATGEEKQLSVDGTLSNYYSSYIRWSPDSKKVASYKIRPVEKRYVYYVESSPASQLQPILHKQEYAKPGDELPFKVPCIYHVEDGKRIIPSTELFAQQYELTGLSWNDDSQAVTFDYNQRGHKVYRVLELSAQTGQVRPLVEETHDKYVNYVRYFRHDLADGKRMIWMSERDNWEHLYMIDRQSAQPLHQITRGEWYVRSVIRVDEEKEQIYFSANGVQKEDDPYLMRYYRIDFDGRNMVCLTPETGNHQAWFSADMNYLVDVYSSVDKAPVAVLRRAADGQVVMPLETADISRLLANGWKAPEVFVAPGRDGKTPMWGLIARPTNFDPSKKYPIIEYIYQGPGDQYVPKYFISHNRYMTSLAELGFIVVMVDGMGTSFRSRQFENICYQNLKDAGLPDHIAWIKAAAEKYPYMDIDRVGIYGCSAGGQESTAAVLFHPEFYKAAYSACGCHDNRMDKIWWNELWMGYPVDEHYAANSNVENAHLLTRPLMLVVGELDDNVDPASTMQVANALIKANIDFELVVIPGAAHTVGEAFGEHKRYDFFVRHLMNVTPPKWNELNK
ncbi:MAG: DPP IV N-terminal domain-containing protein [Bacteroides sp.]|nr:DPP IV N-terminal domain-containing protein [Bacteroides sp.]